MISLLLSVLLCSVQCNPVLSLNILGIFPYEGQSHFFVFEKYLDKLVEKGHNLTVISYFPREAVIPNYHDVRLVGSDKNKEGAFPMDNSYSTVLRIMDYVVTSGANNCKEMLETESVQEIWKSKRKFDLVVMEKFNSDCGLGLAHVLGAPVVALTSNDLMPWHYKTLRLPINPQGLVGVLTGDFKPTLYERVEMTILDCIFRIKYMRAQKMEQQYLATYFGDIPPLEELSRGIKFWFLYRSFLLSGSRLLPSNAIEVGGYHVKASKPLPIDLLKFINESEHGVIYISFGSMLRESSLPRAQLVAIIDTLATLPQRVIWKWNGDTFAGDRNKTYVSKWLPQNDLLAHPNVLAFFSHCGLLSTTEAVHHGVPMVVMPVLEDQVINAVGVVQSGLGVQILINELTKENLMGKFKTVLDLNFRSRVKSLSKAFSDRPSTAMDVAIFWTEFAAHYNLTFGNHAAEVPLYQYLSLDTIVTMAVLSTICLIFLLKILRTILLGLRHLGNLKVKVKRS